jgi:hypothetical protein
MAAVVVVLHIATTPQSRLEPLTQSPLALVQLVLLGIPGTLAVTHLLHCLQPQRQLVVEAHTTEVGLLGLTQAVALVVRKRVMVTAPVVALAVTVAVAVALVARIQRMVTLMAPLVEVLVQAVVAVAVIKIQGIHMALAVVAQVFTQALVALAEQCPVAAQQGVLVARLAL